MLPLLAGAGLADAPTHGPASFLARFAHLAVLIAMLIASYDKLLVVVSLLVAILASFTALDMAERINTTSRQQSRAARFWLTGGAVAMGVGIWSMHFIGMLAFRLPIALGYDVWITCSLLIAMATSGFALWIVTRSELPLRRLFGSALLMGTGIAGMHYTGMAAMRMQPGIDYDLVLFLASILIAVAPRRRRCGSPSACARTRRT
jgi:NO-binding membrane sensor protein with MHYT domain